MNVRFVTCFIAVIGLVCAGVKGDVTALPDDPPIAPAAQSALDMTPFGSELAKVGVEVDKLLQNSDDKPTVSMVRNWLINQDPPTATNPYQEAYATALNQAFLNALSQPSAPVTAKINMGIVISSLAGPKANLAPTVVKLLGDANPAVTLWGVKAVGAMLPWALQNNDFNVNGTRDAILAAVEAAVSSHSGGPLAGPIADEAYRAINPKMWRAGSFPTGDALSALIEANLKLQQNRLTIYFNTGVPAFPQGDSYPSYLLLSDQVWPVMSPTQQLQAVQQAANFVSLAGQRFAMANGAVNQDLIEALQEEGKWITKLGLILSDQQIQDVGTAVNKLSAAMPAGSVKEACDNVIGALENNPAFSNLTQTPTIGGVAPKSASDNSGGSTPTSEARP